VPHFLTMVHCHVSDVLVFRISVPFIYIYIYVCVCVCVYVYVYVYVCVCVCVCTSARYVLLNVLYLSVHFCVNAGYDCVRRMPVYVNCFCFRSFNKQL
jgi:hypothetical protein